MHQTWKASLTKKPEIIVQIEQSFGSINFVTCTSIVVLRFNLPIDSPFPILNVLVTRPLYPLFPASSSSSPLWQGRQHDRRPFATAPECPFVICRKIRLLFKTYPPPEKRLSEKLEMIQKNGKCRMWNSASGAGHSTSCACFLRVSMIKLERRMKN